MYALKNVSFKNILNTNNFVKWGNFCNSICEGGFLVTAAMISS